LHKKFPEQIEREDMSPTGDTLRVHVQNQEGDDDTFALTEKIWAEAVERNRAAAAGLEVTVGHSDADFAQAMTKAEMLITWTAVVKARFPHPAPNLKLIFCTSAGLDRLLPFDWLPEGVRICNNSGVHSDKAGEFGIMSILMLNNRMPQFQTQQRERNYGKAFSSFVGGKTLVAVGIGNMGGPVAMRAKQFGMRVIGVRAKAEPHPHCDRVVTVDQLDQVLPEADFLLLAMPLTDRTRGLVTKARLDLLKPTAGIVNIARGAVIDQDALCDKLDAGTLSGAVLDVFTPEPVPADSRLWTTRNLTMTPHVSSDDPLTYIPRSLDLFFQNLTAWRAGKPLPNEVDRALGY
jgi:phosphoglycerate dehydrogenase-like enzyme